MGLPFPEWAIDHAWIAGADWPHADEDMLEALGDRLAEVAEVLLGDEVSDAIYTALRSNAAAYAGGDGGSAIEDALRGLLDGGIALAEGFSEAATATYEYSDDIFSAKVQGYIALGWLVAEIAWAMLAGPAGPLIHITALTIAREFFERLGQALVRKIANQLLRLGARKVPTVVIAHGAAELIEEGITEAAQGTVEEIGAQTVLINSGRQDGIDWARVAVNAGVSALAGAGGGLGGHIAHRQFAKIPGLSVNRLGGLTQGLAVGGIAGLSGGVTAALVTGRWDPKALLGGVISGAAPSAVYGWKGTSDHAGVSIAQAAQQMQTQKPWMSAMEAQARADTMVENQHKQVDSQPLSSSERAAAHSAIDRTNQAVTEAATTSGDNGKPQVNQHARLSMLEQVDGADQGRPAHVSPFQPASDGTVPPVQAAAHTAAGTPNAAGGGLVPGSGTQAAIQAATAPNAVTSSGTATSTPAAGTASPISADPTDRTPSDVETISAAAEAAIIVRHDSITRDLATILESFEKLVPGRTAQRLDQVAAQLIPPIVAATQQSTGPLRVQFTQLRADASSTPRVRVTVTDSGKAGIGSHSITFELSIPNPANAAVQPNHQPQASNRLLAAAVPLSGFPVGVQAAYAPEPAATTSGRQPAPTFTAAASSVSGSDSSAEMPRPPKSSPTSHPLRTNPNQPGRHPDQHPPRFVPPSGPITGPPPDTSNSLDDPHTGPRETDPATEADSLPPFTRTESLQAGITSPVADTDGPDSDWSDLTALVDPPASGAEDDGAVPAPQPSAELGRLGWHYDNYGTDDADGGFQGVSGGVLNGVLHCRISRGPGTPSGREMFREMVAAFSGRVQVFEAQWRPGFGSSNIDSFNTAVRAGMAPESAVWETFSGKMARQELGMDRAVIDRSKSRIGADGVAIELVVTYSRAGLSSNEDPADGSTQFSTTTAADAADSQWDDFTSTQPAVEGYSYGDRDYGSLGSADHSDPAPVNTCVPDSLSRVAADQAGVVDVPDVQPGNLSGMSWGETRPLLRGAQLEGFPAGDGTGHAALIQGLIHEGGPGAMAWVLDARATVDQHGVGAHAYSLKYLGRRLFEVDGRSVTYVGTDEYGREWFQTENGALMSLAELTGGNREETVATWAAVWRDGQVVHGVGDPGLRPPDDDLRIGRTPESNAAEDDWRGPLAKAPPAAYHAGGRQKLIDQRAKLSAQREKIRSARAAARIARDGLPATAQLAAALGLDPVTDFDDIDRALSPAELTATLEMMLAGGDTPSRTIDPDDPFRAPVESGPAAPWTPVPSRSLAELQSVAEALNDLDAELRVLDHRIADLDRRIGPPQQASGPIHASADQHARSRALEAQRAAAMPSSTTKFDVVGFDGPVPKIIDDSVLFIPGPTPRIVVIGLPSDSGAELDQAFNRAMQLDSGVSQAIQQSRMDGTAQTTVEYQRLTVTEDGGYQLNQVPGPTIRVPDGAAVLRGQATDITLWRDSAGEWRTVPIPLGKLEFTHSTALGRALRTTDYRGLWTPSETSADHRTTADELELGTWNPMPSTAIDRARVPTQYEDPPFLGFTKYAIVRTVDPVEAGLLQGVSTDTPPPEMMFSKGQPFALAGDYLVPDGVAVTEQDLGEHLFQSYILGLGIVQRRGLRHPWTLDFIQHRPWLGRFPIWATSWVPGKGVSLAEIVNLAKNMPPGASAPEVIARRIADMEDRYGPYAVSRWLPFFRSAGQYPWFRQGQANPQPLHDDPMLFRTPDGTYAAYHQPLHQEPETPQSDIIDDYAANYDLLLRRRPVTKYDVDEHRRRAWPARQQGPGPTIEGDIASLREEEQLQRQAWERLQEWTARQYDWIEQHRGTIVDRIAARALADVDRYSGGDKRTWVFSAATNRWVRDADGSHLRRHPDGSTWLRDSGGALRPAGEIRAAIEQVLDHAMRNEFRFDAQPHRARLDQSPDVVTALNRLDNGVPLRADIVMIEDFRSEAAYLAAHPGHTWEDANRHAKVLGFDWDANRPELTGTDSWEWGREPLPWNPTSRVWRTNNGFGSAWPVLGMLTGRQPVGIQFPAITPLPEQILPPVNTCVSDSLARVAADQGPVVHIPDIEPGNPSGKRWRDVRPLLKGARLEGIPASNGRTAHANLIDRLRTHGGPGAIAWVVDQRATVDKHGVGAHAYDVKFLEGNKFEVDGRAVTYDGVDEQGNERFITAEGNLVSLAELTGGTLAETTATWAAAWHDSKNVGIGDPSLAMPDQDLRIGRTTDDDPPARIHNSRQRTAHPMIPPNRPANPYIWR
ncbi:WXG100-like domain-containing protein [Nocardia goodfellowii]